MMLALIALVAADIPVHCLISDFAGEWVLHVGQPVMPGSHSPAVPDFSPQARGIEDEYCYSGHPNRNSENVELDLASRLASDMIPVKRLHANLTEQIKVRDDETEHMAAALNGEEASWTTTYDEGFEIRLGPQYRYFALAKYKCADLDGCGRDGVGENADGSVDGYQSQCGQTLVGWYHTPEGKGCFFGEKVDKTDANAVHSYVLLQKKAGMPPVHTAYHRQDFGFTLPAYASVLELHKDTANALRAGFRTQRRAGSIRRVRAAPESMKVRDQCRGDDIGMADEIAAMEKQHPVFDWRNELGGKWNVAVQDQGGCGSCYAIAMTYVLQSRANIMRLRELQAHGMEPSAFPLPTTLSAHSVLSCSYYNQGCDGGYPYLVAKHAADFGIPLESCAAYGMAAHGSVRSCNGECYADESKVVYAENYNYVGGFYGVCGQARMMKSLLENGPIVIALEVPDPFNDADDSGKVIGDWDDSSDPPQNLRNEEGAHPNGHHRRDPQEQVKMLEGHWAIEDKPGCSADASVEKAALNTLAVEFRGAFVPRDGKRFSLNSDELPTGLDAHKVAQETIAKTAGVAPECVRLNIVDGTMNGWEYTNHAIVVVGWGEHEVEHDGAKTTEKYWIIRNSWGDSFGDNGYAYLTRGKDYAGIESQAVDVKVDRTRGMMKAWLDEMQKPQSLAEIRHVSVDAQGNFATE